MGQGYAKREIRQSGLSPYLFLCVQRRLLDVAGGSLWHEGVGAEGHARRMLWRSARLLLERWLGGITLEAALRTAVRFLSELVTAPCWQVVTPSAPKRGSRGLRTVQ
jgi:hypothetical protein